MDEFIRKAATVKPSERQLAWQETEFYAFTHFTVNAYTDKEWGDGTESPSIFNPEKFDAAQWVNVVKSAGMKGLIITAKHHDGFCLWPSKFTDHSVKSSPWRDGKGDIVGEVAKACREGGIKFGIYLSPWDRHERTYGDSPKYNEYYLNQLRELLTNYGELFSVWFDGACGEGPNGKRQVYDWPAYYALIRELQPNACISICGPDVRWCGNEAGHCRPSEWSVVPAETGNPDKVAENSQKTDDPGFAVKFDFSSDDIGSREKITGASRLVWYPAEVDTSIRPGWFYHPAEDDKVRPLNELINVYFNSVGGNANLLLNFPPDRRGLIHENDAVRSKEIGDVLKKTFADNLAKGARVSASHTRRGGGALLVLALVDGKRNTYWTTDDGQESATLEFSLMGNRTFNVARLREHIKMGQRIEKFRLSALAGAEWKPFAEGTTVGYQRLLRFPQVTAQKVRVEILESRLCPTLSDFSLFYNPKLPPPGTK